MRPALGSISRLIVGKVPKQRRARRCSICLNMTHDWEEVDQKTRCWDCGRRIREAVKAIKLEQQK